MIWPAVTIQSVLDKKTKKGVLVFNSIIRDYPELAYVWIYMPNYFKDGGKMKYGGLTYEDMKSINFKSIGALEADMTINQNEVTHWEADLIVEEADITVAVSTAGANFTVAADKIRFFKVGDVVVKQPKLGWVTPRLQAEITAVNTNTNVITLNASTTAEVGDRIVMAYNLFNYGTEINRWVAKGDVKPVTTYFQRFGESIEFNSHEINQTYLLESAEEYIKSKFAVAINMSNNRFAKAFYLGRNIAGNRSETQGLDNVINNLESTYGLGSHIIDFTGITDAKAKAKKLVQTINYFNSAPLYNGVESPTFFVNDVFITNLSEIMYDMGNDIPLNNYTIEFGLQSYKSPYFKNVQFVVSQTINRLEPYTSVAYVFPKHLVTFRTPEYQSVNESGALVKTKVGGYEIIKMPQVSVDIVKYTAQLAIANIFGGQSIRASYGKIVNL